MIEKIAHGLTRKPKLVACIAVLLLIPGGVTNDWTPRIACVPFFICIAVVKYAENIRKVLGENKRK